MAVNSPDTTRDRRPARSAGGRFASSAFAMFQRDVFIYVVLFASSIVIARVLLPARMGVWSILLLIPSYAAAFGRLQTDTASVYFVARKQHGVGESAFVLNVIALIMAALAVAAFFGLQGWLFDSPLRELDGARRLAYLMVASVPLEFLSMNYAYLLLGRNDVTGYNRQNVIRALTPPVAGVAALLVVGPSVEALVWSVLGGTALAVAHGAWRVHSAQPLKVAFRTVLFRDVLKFGLKLYLGSVASFLGLYLVGLTVAIYLTSTDVAYFQIALARALLLAKIAAAVAAVLYPTVAALTGMGDEATRLTARAFRITLLLTVTAAGAAMLFAGPAVRLIYGAEYAGVVLPLLVLIPAVAVDSATSIFTQYFIGRGRPMVTTAFTFAVLMPQIAVLWIVVPRWGVAGAAWATAAALTLGAAVRVAAFVVISGAGLRELAAPRREDVTFIWRFFAGRLKALSGGHPCAVDQGR